MSDEYIDPTDEWDKVRHEISDWDIVAGLKTSKEYEEFTRTKEEFMMMVIELGDDEPDRCYHFKFVPAFGGWGWTKIDHYKIMMASDDGEYFEVD